MSTLFVKTEAGACYLEAASEKGSLCVYGLVSCVTSCLVKRKLADGRQRESAVAIASRFSLLSLIEGNVLTISAHHS